jgi:hypothetical protein
LLVCFCCRISGTSKSTLADDHNKELKVGMKAPVSDFTTFDVEEIFAEAKNRRQMS